MEWIKRMSRQSADTRCSTPTKFPFRPDSHLKTFLPGTQSSDISNCSSSESEVSFSGEVSLLTPNISIDDYIAETRESLSKDFKCLECNKTIYYGAFSKCKACLGCLHPSCTTRCPSIFFGRACSKSIPGFGRFFSCGLS